MHQTICGETHKKTRIFQKKVIKNFHELALYNYKKLENNIDCIYSNTSIVSDLAFNYLNIENNDTVDKQLKLLLKSEFNNCEKLYPYLGDLFLDLYFNKAKICEIESFKFHKDNVEDFVSSIENEIVKKIVKFFFDECSMEYFVSIEKIFANEITLLKDENITFDIEYDESYLMNNKRHDMKDYNFIIIDGIIDTLGEIHHLLHKASEDKESYVIFCRGVNSDVKHTILENNKRGITNVFPVSIAFSEESINILNDIAVLHSSDIISSLKGQTISQEVRKKLSVGNQISFMKNNIIISPVCSNLDIDMHRSFLLKRYNDSVDDKNKKLLEQRIKRINSRFLKIFIPDKAFYRNSFIRELDYFLRFLKYNSRQFSILENFNRKRYYIPTNFIEVVLNKVESINKIFDSIENLILFEDII